MMFSKSICRSILHFNRKEVQTFTNGVTRFNQEIETEIKVFLAEDNLSAEEIKEAEVFSWQNSNEKNTHILLGLQKVSFGNIIFCLF